MLAKLKDGHWPIFLLSSFSSVANLYLPIVLARVLAPEQMGVYKIFFLHMGAIPFIFLTGGPLHAVYYWSGRKEPERASYFQQSFTLALLLSALILALGFPLLDVVSGLTSLSRGHTGLLLISAFLSVPAGYYSHAKIALGATVKGSLYDTVFEVLKVATFALIAYKTQDIGYIFLAFCLIFGCKFIIALFLKLKDGMLSWRWNATQQKEIFHYCLPISLAGLVTFFVDKIDQFVLASQLPADEFAFYSMGCLMIPPLYMLEMSVTSVLIPKLAKHASNRKLALASFRKAIADNALFLIPSCFGLWLFATPIAQLLYTEKFIESAEYLKLFAFTYVILAIPYDAVPRATGKTKWVFRLTLAVGALSLVGVIVASRYYGAAETLTVALGFKFLARLAGLAYSARIMNWTLRETIPWRSIAFFALLSAALSAASVALRPLFLSPMNWFYACAPVFACVYLLCAWLQAKNGEAP